MSANLLFLIQFSTLKHFSQLNDRLMMQNSQTLTMADIS